MTLELQQPKRKMVELSKEEKAKIEAKETIEENKMLIVFYEAEIENKKKLIAIIDTGLKELSKSSIDNNYKKDSTKIYQNEKKAHDSNLKKINDEIEKLVEES